MRTTILYDQEENAVGRVTENGKLLTMNGRESFLYLPGPRINKSHTRRVAAYERLIADGSEQDNE